MTFASRVTAAPQPPLSMGDIFLLAADSRWSRCQAKQGVRTCGRGRERHQSTTTRHDTTRHDTTRHDTTHPGASRPPIGTHEMTRWTIETPWLVDALRQWTIARLGHHVTRDVETLLSERIPSVTDTFDLKLPENMSVLNRHFASGWTHYY